MDLDFSKCKTPEDVREVFLKNKDSLDSLDDVKKRLSDLDPNVSLS